MDIKFSTTPEMIVPSSLQTKLWRKSCEWYRGGKYNECELYQRKTIETITNKECIKTNTRMNLFTKEMRNIVSPMKKEDGYEWSENFDGVMNINSIHTLYFNMKMICEKGGSQTRSLREVYHFIHTQLEHILHKENNSEGLTYFINILDGDTSYHNMDKYQYLLQRPLYENSRKYVFVGDMVEFRDWFQSNPAFGVYKPILETNK